jgi:hypothetical protein
MRYFLAHNELDVFHYGELTEEQAIETGQPNLEYFASKGFLIDRLRELGQEYAQDTSEYNNFETFEELPEEPSI